MARNSICTIWNFNISIVRESEARTLHLLSQNRGKGYPGRGRNIWGQDRLRAMAPFSVFLDPFNKPRDQPVQHTSQLGYFRNGVELS